MVRFSISQLPPSVNNLYFNLPHGRGRAQSKEYRAWLSLAGAEIRLMQRVPITSGDVRIDLRFRTNRRRDLDGCLKATLDALVKARVIDDDKCVTAISLEWADVAGVEVTVRSVLP